MPSSIAALMTRVRARLRDCAAYSSTGRALRVILAELSLACSLRPEKRLVRRAALIRQLGAGARRRTVARQLRATINREPERVVAAHHAASGTGRDGKPVTRTALLKAPGPRGERGVIYSAFEYNWVRMMERLGSLRPLLDTYDVVWATSWSPTDYLDVARLVASSGPDDRLYLQATHHAEMPLLAEFHPRIRVVPNLLCEYLDPTSFASRPLPERDIDLLVVANWAPFKRHFELFRALSRLPATLRIVCVGQPERGHTLAEIKQLAAAFGIPQTIEYQESLPLAAVRQLQGRSRAAAIFSLREGCCVAAVEALFAGASLGLVAGAQVGSIAFINPQTGITLRRDRISQDLAQLIADAPNRAPRDWAVAHLGAERATAGLNDWLRQQASDRGLPWTSDIARMAWSPYPWVSDPIARAALEPSAAVLHQRFPEIFAADLIDSSRF